MRTGRAEYLKGEEPILIIKNKGPNIVTFGSYYWLQRHQDGEWITIPFRENVGFAAWLKMLEPGERYRDKIHFGGLTEVPSEGRYRIAKELSIEEMDLTLTKYAEFYIRSSWSYSMVWDRFRLHTGITVLALTVVITILMRRRPMLVNFSANLRSKLSLIQNVPILSSFLKLVAVFTLSALSFFITDFLPAIEWVLGLGVNIGLSITIFIFVRAGLAEWIAYKVIGIRSRFRYRDLALPTLIYSVPLWSFNEAFPLNPLSKLVSNCSKWVSILPVYDDFRVLLIVLTLSLALIIDFPRLILFLAIKNKLSINDMKKDVEVT